MRIAIIVIGSNSTRMLSAQCNTALDNPHRERVETRLFLRMENGAFSAEAIKQTSNEIREMANAAQNENAKLIAVCATSAVRDASNSTMLEQAILNACGLPLRILSGEEEAIYSFYGAAGEQACGMIDIGGGSTELAIGSDGSITHATSLQLGASRLFALQPINAPEDIPLALAQSSSVIRHSSPEFISAGQSLSFYIVGGTGTAAARMLCPHQDENGVILSKADLTALLDQIAKTPRDQRKNLAHFPVSRLDIFPTGLAILLSVMSAFSLETVEVTTRTNADGLLRAFVHKKFA